MAPMIPRMIDESMQPIEAGMVNRRKAKRSFVMSCYISAQEAVEYPCDEHLSMGFSNVSDYDVRHSQEKISIMEDRIHIILNNLNEQFRDTQRRSL